VRSEVVRAYPLRFMRWHEVVNDQLPDGSNVTVVYDTRTAAAVALDNSVLQCYNCTYQGFGNSGFFYESHLLIYDFNSSSLWLPLKVQLPLAKHPPPVQRVGHPLSEAVCEWRVRRDVRCAGSRRSGSKRCLGLGTSSVR
jgi:hypothetical protein